MLITEREKFLIPLRALGQKATLLFPQFVDFSLCPVKFLTERPVMLRNAGDKPTKWSIDLHAPFNADVKEGLLEVGKAQQINFSFNPTRAKLYKEDCVLIYDGTQQHPVTFIGEAHNDNVYLSLGHVTCEDT